MTVHALPSGPNADAAAQVDLFDAGWRWCANNRRWYRAPRNLPPELEAACVGCGQSAPPPLPSPYDRRPRHDEP